jgi:predicted amidohydrolase
MTMRIAAVQHDIEWEDREANLRRLTPKITDAAADGAELVVLAEMFAVGFTMDTEKVAEPPGGPTERWMVERAADTNAWLMGSVPVREPDDPRPFNRLLAVAPDGSVHTYDKRHPFSYAGEHEHFRAGEGSVTVTVGGLRITPLICYDLRFADAFWTLAPSTDCYVVVASWPEARRHHWRTLLTARAIENQAWVVGVNRVGSGGGLQYVGDSLVVDPMGEIVAEASGGEATVVTDVDPDRVGEVRSQLPFMADRR